MTELVLVFLMGVIVGVGAHQCIYLGVKEYYKGNP